MHDMPAKNDNASAINQANETWVNPAPVANDTSAAPKADISTADAFGALADAVTAYINAPHRLKDRRLAVNRMSELLREVFCLRGAMLADVPKQLGTNHDAAADYIYNQLDRWAAQPILTELFDTVGLAEDVRPVIILSTMRLVPAEEIGVWLCAEFGDLSASREADHARRYVATKISTALFDLSKAQPSLSFDNPNALQYQLDDWASPTGGIEQSLHYQMVIAPFLNFFHEIATGRLASSTAR